MVNKKIGNIGAISVGGRYIANNFQFLPIFFLNFSKKKNIANFEQKMEEDEEIWEKENEKFFLIIYIINCMPFLIITIINCLQRIEDQETITRENELLCFP